MIDLAGNADEIVGPVALALGGQHVELHVRLVPIAAQGEASVAPQPEGDGDMPVDGGRQDEALVIVRVLADEIDASGRHGHGARRITKRLPESGSGAFIELVRRAHDGWAIRANSQSSASVAFSAIGNSGSVRS